MPKVKSLPKKPKNKQKQKQKQSQHVVVNINTTTKKPARTKTARTRSDGGSIGIGGVGAFSRPLYLNSPSDYAPIIHNQPHNIPSQFSNIPTITMPSHALNNVHIPPQITYPTPTQLQSSTEDVRPLSALSDISRMSPASIDIDTPRPRYQRPTTVVVEGRTLSTIPPPMSFMEVLRAEQARRASRPGLGSTVIGSNIPSSRNESPFVAELTRSISQRSSRQGTPQRDLSPSLMRPRAESIQRMPRRTAGEVAEARGMGGNDRPPRPRGRPIGS